ncbi:TetR/AcrR family transcriptional regulator [Prescottella sp. R16]|uniref:TetR/AcrR family transcriptional regulator n=1 Tax=Prescottella sp. R16 TaxID=3064529 RepID=UPI00272E6040|nr:TetR/AcrR family transcriptional regulator [Prescottella sp. R16]
MTTRVPTEDPKMLVAQAACDLVAEGGLENATLRKVAARLGTTTGYISHYFAGKEELLEAALTAALEEVSGKVARRTASATLDEWLEMIEQALPHDAESQRFWRVLVAFHAFSLNSSRLQTVLQSYAADGERRMAEMLETTLPDDVPVEDVQSLARAVWVLVDGIGTTAVTNPGALSREQQSVVIRASVDALIDRTVNRKVE